MDEKEAFQVYDEIGGSAGMDAEELFFLIFFFRCTTSMGLEALMLRSCRVFLRVWAP
jgi:hypothetical protein